MNPLALAMGRMSIAPFIGMLIGGIIALKYNCMIDTDYYLKKFEDKYNCKIDKKLYCKFEGKEKIRLSIMTIILITVLFKLNFRDINIFWIIIIFSIIDYFIYLKKRKKFINKFPKKEIK
ncbi:hypothetical protein [Paraclostridium sordellii]|nr:hypothetical protein [Paeniclostridium sordellii]EPZ61126.1 hypothetical protein H476_0322 [[Clostridium] sordellii VPI 9048] [Paeniclostridium sordellii VPI 9048]CEK40095.1 putative membrane protein (plasmid) [[Clostridium] sordellii] [Paeniclostridium sordellii]